MKDVSFLVWVYCITYNQSHYIVDTMDGFCKQQTTFPFVCSIIDDASTDGEREVIKKYLQKNFVYEKDEITVCEENDDFIRYFAQHKTNNNCFFNVFLLKYNHYSIKKSKLSYVGGYDGVKYMAFCEGDDYWINPSMLQKQVSFLECHDDYCMCCGGYRIHINGVLENEVVFKKNDSSGYTFSLEDNLEKWHTKTLTSVIRIQDKEEYDKKRSKYKFTRDTHLFYHVLAKGKGYYFSEVMGVYNKHSGGIFSMKSIGENAFVAAYSYKELYENNNHDNRLEKALFTWLCIAIKESHLSSKEAFDMARNAQRLVNSISREKELIKSIGIYIYRKIRYDKRTV